ncbi:MAG: GGDEF domain-containing protein [Desulfosarcinaceae bacterium]|nr:GGDEF domain-containing protein [Desulfosarcinaceae bacterium]
MAQTFAFEQIVRSDDRLPTLPGIAMRIIEVVNDPEADLHAIAEVVATDPSLSAEVLKVINSAFFGLPNKITSVFHAVNLMGSHAVKNLALGFSLVKHLRSGESPATATPLFDYAGFWKRSLATGVAARALAHRHFPNFSEDAFFLGLMHDIGMLALTQAVPDQYSLILQEMTASGCTAQSAERHVLGFDHAHLGAYLATSWGLPESFSVSLLRHHRPETLRAEERALTNQVNLLHLAALFGELFASSQGVDAIDPVLQLKVIAHYAAQCGMGDHSVCEAVASEIGEKAQEVFPIFDLDPGSADRYHDIVAEARQALVTSSMDMMAELIAQQRQIETLKQQTTRDGMTQLSNYQHFNELLHQECYRARRYKQHLGVLFADLDHFKTINDTFGHPAGDEVLKQVATSLREALRESDHLARYGGEEFAMILPETDADGTLLAAERLRKAVAALHIETDAGSANVTLSLGAVAVSPGAVCQPAELVKRADDALYQAKASGRNRSCMAA